MATQKELMNEMDDIEVKYRENKDLLENWKNTFRRLEQEVNSLNYSFEHHYKQSAINESFDDSLKEKLENRREGIRLTVKSASRLMRRLNPEKPLEESTDPFTFKENSSKVEVVAETEVDSELVVELKQEEQEMNSEQNLEVNADTELKSEREGEGKPETVLDSKSDDETCRFSNLKQDVVVNSSNLVLIQESELKEETQGEESSDSQENKDDINNIDLEGKPEKSEGTDEILQRLDNDEESLEVSAIHDAIKSNYEVIQKLQDHIQAAEKRYITFMEKGLAPVMDGLFSGQNYANDLLEELNTSGVEGVEAVKEWLDIYDVMMAEITKAFDDFEIELDIPNRGDQFDEYKHEPIGVIEDLSLKDEQIKSVVRFGLTSRKPIFGQESFLIRPAQVIVVKNMNLPLEDVQEGNQE